MYYTRNIKPSGVLVEESCTNLLPMEMLWMAEGEDKFGGCEIGAREREGGGRRRMQPRRRPPLLCRKEGGQRPRESGMESRTYGWAEEGEEEVARSPTRIPNLDSFHKMLLIVLCCFATIVHYLLTDTSALR